MKNLKDKMLINFYNGEPLSENIKSSIQSAHFYLKD